MNSNTGPPPKNKGIMGYNPFASLNELEPKLNSIYGYVDKLSWRKKKKPNNLIHAL